MKTISKSKIDILFFENEISSFIKEDNGCSTHFEYNKSHIDNSIESIRVTTYNPKKNETFLLIEIPCDDEVDGLKSVLDWIKSHKLTSQDISHTILWMKKGEGVTYKSYFYATSVRKALDKFFFDKKEDDYIIYEVKMNPIA